MATKPIFVGLTYAGLKVVLHKDSVRVRRRWRDRLREGFFRSHNVHPNPLFTDGHAFWDRQQSRLHMTESMWDRLKASDVRARGEVER